MKYSQLNKTQKRCVDAFVKIRPDLATQETITRPEIEMLFHTLHDARADGGEKIGYPMWNVKNLKISRGVYGFPAPGLDNAAPSEKPVASKTKVEKQASVKVEEEDKEFFTELAEHGIMETTE